MHSAQCKASRGVIELAIRPADGVVAGLARRREIRRDVVDRRFRRVVVSLMTRDAGGNRDVVVAVDVAVRTLARRNCMCAGEREARLRVIEVGRRPGIGRVATVAGLREIAGNVIGILCALEILKVARNTGRLRDVVVSVDVAIDARTRRHSMLAREYPAGLCVIELAIRPRDRIVACLAGSREVSPKVIDRSLGIVIVGLVAAHA